MATMRARIVVTGTGSEGTGPAVSLNIARVAEYSKEETPLVQILLNCGECTCRILNEMRTKLSRVSHLLLTRCHPSRVSGIPSLLFHLSDRGGGKLNIVGPRGVQSYIDAVRTFVKRQNPVLDITELHGDAREGDTQYEFDSMEDSPETFVWAQHLAPTTGLKIESIPLHRTGSAKRPRTSEQDESTASSCQLQGLAYGIVVQGPAENRDEAGEVKKKKTVLKRSILVVVDCCSEEEVAVSQAAIKKWLAAKEFSDEDSGRTTMLHLAERSVLRANEYQEWMLETSSSVRHLSLDARHTEGGVEEHSHFPALNLQTLSLHCAEPFLFPSPSSGSPEGACHLESETLSFCTSALPPLSSAPIFPHALDPDHSDEHRHLRFFTIPSAQPHPEAGSPLIEWRDVDSQLPQPTSHQPQPQASKVETAASAPPTALSAAEENMRAARAMKRRMMGLPPEDDEAPSSAAPTDDKPGPSQATETARGGSQVGGEPEQRLCVEGAGEVARESGNGGKGGRAGCAREEWCHLVLLGTGAAAPSKLRSCSGILLNVPCRSNAANGGEGRGRGGAWKVLLDCGEGCVARLMGLAERYREAREERDGTGGRGAGATGRRLEGVGAGTRETDFREKSKAGEDGARGGDVSGTGRRCGAAGLHRLMLEVHVVWISHMHGDHHTGLPNLLRLRAEAEACSVCSAPTHGLQQHGPHPPMPEQQAQRPMLLVGPWALKNLVANYLQILHAATLNVGHAPGVGDGRGRGEKHFWVPCLHFSEFHVERCGLGEGEMLRWRSVPVEHSQDAHGAVLTVATPSGLQVLAYSGDTRPCQRLVRAIADDARDASALQQQQRASWPGPMGAPQPWGGMHQGGGMHAGGPWHVGGGPGGGGPGGGGPGHWASREVCGGGGGGGGPVRVVVVHEATLNAGSEEEARRKRHSTVAEAVGVAGEVERMAPPLPWCEVAGTVLTHFSQRYPSIPGWRDEQRAKKALAHAKANAPRADAHDPTAQNPPAHQPPSSANEQSERDRSREEGGSGAEAELPRAGQPAATAESIPRPAGIKDRVLFGFDGLSLPLEQGPLQLVFLRSQALRDRFGEVQALVGGREASG